MMRPSRNKAIVVAAAVALCCALLFRALPRRAGPSPDLKAQVELSPIAITHSTATNSAAGEPILEGRQPPASHSNAAQQKLLQKQADEMGIQSLSGEEAEQAPESFLGNRLGEPGSRAQAEAYIRRFGQMRRSIEQGKSPPVALSGEIVPVLAEPDEQGSAIEEKAEPGVWRGDFGGGRAGTFTVTGADAWAKLWGELGQDAPALDFEKKQVVAVFLGERPTGGYRVELEAPAASKSALVLRYRESAPAAGPVPEGKTSPYVMRAIPKSPLPVRFKRAP